ncbi:unnamed protein product [Caenorhabditis brenneri]
MPTLIPYQNSYSYSYSANSYYPTPTVPGYIEPLATTTDSTYRGPPASVPISEEQIPPVTLPDSAYGDQALSQLEDELAAEKYKYNLQKAAEEKQKKEKQKQGRIRVFKIKPQKTAPKLNTGMVEWQSSQVAKYTTIEIGSEPEFADEEPAGPQTNVRNRISHDPVLVNSVLQRQFIL